MKKAILLSIFTLALGATNCYGLWNDYAIEASTSEARVGKNYCKITWKVKVMPHVKQRKIVTVTTQKTVECTDIDNPVSLQKPCDVLLYLSTEGVIDKKLFKEEI